MPFCSDMLQAFWTPRPKRILGVLSALMNWSAYPDCLESDRALPWLLPRHSGRLIAVMLCGLETDVHLLLG